MTTLEAHLDWSPEKRCYQLWFRGTSALIDLESRGGLDLLAEVLFWAPLADQWLNQRCSIIVIDTMPEGASWPAPYRLSSGTAGLFLDRAPGNLFEWLLMLAYIHEYGQRKTRTGNLSPPTLQSVAKSLDKH